MTLVLGAFGWGLITVGAITHVWHHDRLRRLLALHLPFERGAAGALAGTEVALGIGLFVAVLTEAWWLGTLAACGLLVGLGFTAWIARLLLTGSTLPCACSFSDAPTTAWSLVRAIAVTSVGLLGFVDDTLTGGEVLAGFAVGLAAAAALYVLPESLAWPQATRAQLARLDSHGPGTAGLASDR